MLDDIQLGQPDPIDLVNHPPHYTKNGIECIQAIRASMTDEGYMAFLKGNVLKYLWRYEHKNGLQDLQKAEWYLKELIEVMAEPL